MSVVMKVILYDINIIGNFNGIQCKSLQKVHDNVKHNKNYDLKFEGNCIGT